MPRHAARRPREPQERHAWASSPNFDSAANHCASTTRQVPALIVNLLARHEYRAAVTFAFPALKSAVCVDSRAERVCSGERRKRRSLASRPLSGKTRLAYPVGWPCADPDRFRRLPEACGRAPRNDGPRAIAAIPRPRVNSPHCRTFGSDRVQKRCRPPQREHIALGSATGDHAVRALADVGMATKSLSLVYVRDVNFQHGTLIR